MNVRDKAIKSVFLAIDEVNEVLPAEARITKSLDTVLLGPSSSLESLGLVNLIVQLEQQLQDEFGVEVDLADQRLVAPSQGPIDTIASLVDYVVSLVAHESTDE